MSMLGSLVASASGRHPARARYLDAGRPDGTDSAPNQWWKSIPGIGLAGARRIDAFFAAHPALTERARALTAVSPTSSIAPWEQLRLPHEVDGSAGVCRAPPAHSTQTTITGPFRGGCRRMSLPRRGARTARRPSASSRGRSWRGGRCSRSPPRTRSPFARSCAVSIYTCARQRDSTVLSRADRR